MTGPRDEGAASPTRTAEAPAPAVGPLWARLLGAFADGELLVYPADWARRHGEDKAPVYRVCAEMEAAGFFEKSDHAAAIAYRAGPRVFALAAGALASNAYEAQRLVEQLTAHARFLHQISERCEQTFGAATAPRAIPAATPAQEQSA